ncbi:hypothetical protein O998_05020 [Anaplasma phagocytophilum str. Norway variant1]|uniref:Uncharacterized protein n=1 Tax=Anaplasma phagocytophilum str. Norway variant1 TaxID=1392506 RepID=A0A7H9DZT7_ANAPH|nr:hypothetical protein O998_05020 [Anaplasma phagocytophilum str. Norway variant1]
MTSDSNTAQCSGFNAKQDTMTFSEFAKTLGLEDGKYWPTGGYANSSTPTMNAQNSNAKAVAKDLVQELTPEEKTIVTGLLAKTTARTLAVIP